MAGRYEDIYGLAPDLRTLGQPDPIGYGDMIHFAGRDQAMAVPPEMAGLPIEPEPIPDDFWARMAMAGGPQPFQFNPGHKPTGLEVLLAALAGFGNARAAGGARRVGQATQRNKEVNENARALALHRHQMAREKLEQQGATERTRITQAGANERFQPRLTADEWEAVRRSQARGTSKGRVDAGGTPTGTKTPPKPERTTPTFAETEAEKRRKFEDRKRAALSDINGLKDVFGKAKREKALDSIKDYLRANPDVDDDPEVERALLRAVGP
jgi:hypothetical protein